MAPPSRLVVLAVALLAVACGGAPSPLKDGGGGGEPEPLTDGGALPGEPDAGPRMGANVSEQGVEFRVWAPHATAAWVEGDFGASVALAPEPGGLFYAQVSAAREGSVYRFSLETPAGKVARVDPYCRQLEPDGKSCKVIHPGSYAWSTPPFQHPPRNALVVYELHVGSFAVPNGTAVGTLERARGRLAELAELGVNVVELMPVQAFGGRANSWGYNPQLFFAPKASYGTADDLRRFVDEAHAKGLAVWLDTVVNHVDGWRQAPLVCFDGHCPDGAWGVHFFPPGPYATTPWGPRPNYAEPQVASMLLASARQWLEEFRGDGFRWDSVSNIRAQDGNGTTPGGKALLVAANELTRARGGFSVAEDLKGYAAITQPVSKGGFGFDAQWDGFGYDVVNQLAPYADDGRDLGAIEGALRGGFSGDGFARLLWTENHDTVGNGGARLPVRVDAATPESFAGRRRSMLAAALLFTSPGVPMLFMGQETLATTGFTDPPVPLPAATPVGAKVRAFYKDLIALRRNLGGKSGGLLEPGVDVLHRNDANKVIAYRRRGPSGEDVLVVLNLRNRAYARYDFGVPAGGKWSVRLDADWKRYGDDFAGGQQGLIDALDTPRDGQPFTLPVQLGAYGVVVLTR